MKILNLLHKLDPKTKSIIGGILLIVLSCAMCLVEKY